MIARLIHCRPELLVAHSASHQAAIFCNSSENASSTGNDAAPTPRLIYPIVLDALVKLCSTVDLLLLKYSAQSVAAEACLDNAPRQPIAPDDVTVFEVFDYAIWFSLAEREDSLSIVTDVGRRRPDLLEVIDGRGRHILDVLHPTYVAACLKCTLLYGRYVVSGNNILFKNRRVSVHRAEDRKTVSLDSGQRGRAGEGLSRPPVPVVLKFFRSRTAFMNALTVFKEHELDEERYVLGVYSPEGNREIFTAQQHHMGYSRLEYGDSANNYPYCIVYPFADYSLLQCWQIHAELWGSVAFVRKAYEEIAWALDHLHSFGIIHSELTPQHVLYHNGRWKLTGFGSYVNARVEAGAGIAEREGGPRKCLVKTETATIYCPPEYLHINPCTGRVVPRSAATSHVYGGLEANVSYDMWSLGVLLYQITAMHEETPPEANFLRRAMSMCHESGTASAADLREVGMWNEDALSALISTVNDSDLWRLLTALLHPDPGQRPRNMSVVIDCLTTASREREALGSGLASRDLAEYVGKDNLDVSRLACDNLDKAHLAMDRLDKIGDLLSVSSDTYPTIFTILPQPLDRDIELPPKANREQQKRSFMADVVDVCDRLRGENNQDRVQRKIRQIFDSSSAYVYLLCDCCFEPQTPKYWPLEIKMADEDFDLIAKVAAPSSYPPYSLISPN